MAESSEKALSHSQQSLAMLLEFLSKLQEKPDVRNKVIEEIKEKVEAYVKDDGKFADEDATGGYLYKTIEKSKELRRNIVKSEETEYRYYTNDLKEDETSKYSQHLIDNVFPLFGCLYYMYFECSQRCILIKGSDWKTEKCDGSSGGRKDNLKQWLTDTTGAERMIKRNFQQEHLGQKTGSDLFPSGSSTDNLLYYNNSAQLQNALYYMLFLPEKWNDAQSGHAVLFLEAFCEMVKDGKFQDKYSHNDKKFKSECEKVQQSIKTLTERKIIAPVACYQEVNYKNLMDEKHFWSYITWLKENLKMLIDSLQAMAMNVYKWEKDKLISSDTFGPYPWGFTFEYNWENDKQKLPMALLELHEALKTLQIAMDNIKHVSSTASTIGSVIGGLGGLGATAGAAYAGSGFLGPVAEGVGRFFKGLFF